MPELTDAQRSQLIQLSEEAHLLPEGDWFDTDSGYPEFEPKDFARMTALYRAVGAPPLETLDVPAWQRTHLAIVVVV